MIIAWAGRHHHVSANGTEINADRKLSVPEVETLVSIMEHAGVTPKDVAGIEIIGEGAVLLHCPFVTNGHLECDHRYVSA